MKHQIKLSLIALAAIAAASCSGNKQDNAATDNAMQQNETEQTALVGQWDIENIVFNDSVYVRPDEETPGIRQYITFEDGTYFIRTNCNTLSGSFTVNGDSITFGDGMMTEMACDNMATEDALRKMLPRISSMDVQNDSVVRLNGAEPAECIMLRKAAAKE